MPWLFNPTRRRLEYRDADDRVIAWYGGADSDTSDLLPIVQQQKSPPPDEVRTLADRAVSGDGSAVGPLLDQLKKIAPQYEQLDLQSAQQNTSLAGTSAYAQDPAYLRAQLGLVQSSIRNVASKDELDNRRRTLQEKARLMGVTLPNLDGPPNTAAAAPGSPSAGGAPQGGAGGQGAGGQGAGGQGGGGTPPGGFTTAMMQDPEYLQIYNAVGDTAVAAHLYGEKRKLDQWEQLLQSHETNAQMWEPLLAGHRSEEELDADYAEQSRRIIASVDPSNPESERNAKEAFQRLKYDYDKKKKQLGEGIAEARNKIFPGMNATLDREYAAGKTDVKGTPGVVRYKDLAPHQRAALFGAAHAASGGASSADDSYQPDLAKEEELARLPRFAAGGEFGGSNPFGGGNPFGSGSGTGYQPGVPGSPYVPKPAPNLSQGITPTAGNFGNSGQELPQPTNSYAGAATLEAQKQALEAVKREGERIQQSINSALQGVAADAQRQMYALQQDRVRMQQQFEVRKQSVLQDFNTRAWALYEDREEIVADNPFIANRAPAEALRAGDFGTPAFPVSTGGNGLPSLGG